MSRRTITFWLAALTVLTALAAAGCGGEDEAVTVPQFQEKVVVARDRVDYALARIPKAESLDEYTSRMDEAAVVIEDAANELEALTPPKGFEPETRRLVKALHQLSIDYSSSADQFRQTPELMTGTLGISFDSWDQVNLALAGLVGNGIDVSVLQPHGRSSS